MIYVVPSIKEPYTRQLEISVDIKLIKMLTKFYKSEVIVLSEFKNLSKKTRLLVISGGNTIKKFSKKKPDIIRDRIDTFYFKQALSKKIPILGICHGAHFIAHKFASNLIKVQGHVGSHYITYKNKKRFFVNSFHNIGINKLGKSLIKNSEANDRTIESYVHKKLKIKGIIWHPERHRFLKAIDKIELKNL